MMSGWHNPLAQGLFLNAAIGALAIAPMLAQSAIPDGDDGPAIAAATIITGILSYSHWPRTSGAVQLCIVGTSALADQLSDRRLVNDRPLQVRRLEPAAIPDAGCDAIFSGRLPTSNRRAIVAYAADKPVVTLTDDDPQCRSGTMICLRRVRAGLTFDLNIDAVSRSQVRIDPRVLTLAQRGGAQP